MMFAIKCRIPFSVFCLPLMKISLLFLNRLLEGLLRSSLSSLFLLASIILV